MGSAILVLLGVALLAVILMGVAGRPGGLRPDRAVPGPDRPGRRRSVIEQGSADFGEYDRRFEELRRCRDAGRVVGLYRQARQAFGDDPRLDAMREFVLFGESFLRDPTPPPAGQAPITEQRLALDFARDRLEMELGRLTLLGFLTIEGVRIHIENYLAPRNLPPGIDPRRYRVVYASGRIHEDEFNRFFSSLAGIERALGSMPRIRLVRDCLEIVGRAYGVGFEIRLGLAARDGTYILVSLLGAPRVMGAIPLPTTLLFDLIARILVERGHGLIHRADDHTLGIDPRPLFPFDAELNLASIAVREKEITFLCDAGRFRSTPRPPPRPTPRLVVSGDPDTLPALHSPLRDSLVAASHRGDPDEVRRILDEILDTGDLMGPDPDLGAVAWSLGDADRALRFLTPPGMVAGPRELALAARILSEAGQPEQALSRAGEALERVGELNQPGDRVALLLDLARLSARLGAPGRDLRQRALAHPTWSEGGLDAGGELEQACLFAQSQGAWSEALGLARIWCSHTPHRSQAHRARAQAHEALGERVDAWLASALAEVGSPGEPYASALARLAPPLDLWPGGTRLMDAARSLCDPPLDLGLVGILIQLAPYLSWIWDPGWSRHGNLEAGREAGRELERLVADVADLLGCRPPRVRLVPSILAGPTRAVSTVEALLLDETWIEGREDAGVRFLVGRCLTLRALHLEALAALPAPRREFLEEALRVLPRARRRARGPARILGLLGSAGGLGTGRFLARVLGARAILVSLWLATVPREVFGTLSPEGLSSLAELESGDLRTLPGRIESLADRGGLLAAGDPVAALRALTDLVGGETCEAGEIRRRGLEWGLERLPVAATRRILELVEYAMSPPFSRQVRTVAVGGGSS